MLLSTEKINHYLTFFALFVLLAICPKIYADYVPWDTLTNDSWILFEGDPNMYPANAGDDTETSYPIAFAKINNKNVARGMNSLKFLHNGQTDGHMVSKDKTGSFQIAYTGDRDFSDILLLVAIDANSLPSDFKMSLNMAGHDPNDLEDDDFFHYSNQYGRPSGYYSETLPNSDPISYNTNMAMVSVFGISGTGGSTILDEFSGPLTIEYSFDSVPAPVVFSVYAYIIGEPIHHTNRSALEVNNPDPAKNKISTFAVTVDGDLNSDLKVNLIDLAIFSNNWLIGTN